MVEISAATTHKVKKKVTGAPIGKKTTKKGPIARRGSVAPPLRPATLGSPEAIQVLLAKNEEDRKLHVLELFRNVLGEQTVRNIGAPHAASTTRDRGAAAADVAIAVNELGVIFVLKTCGILEEMQKILFPQGIEAILGKADEGETTPMTIRPSASAVSLTSLDEATTATTANSIGTDSKRGKTGPPNAREGCLLLIRALCQINGRKVEPYVVGAFLAAAMDECASSSVAIREAAEDTTSALVALAHAWAFPTIICPLLINSLHTNEWRVKAAALERLQQCAATAPAQVKRLIPTLIPEIANQVWDTKAQVSKGAKAALLVICDTNTNPDVKPAIPAVVNAICKPADTNKAITELMGTTFVAPVDASTLAILCPVLARALKEKMAIHKRAACIVISNMSKLVESPQAIAPFGSLLVPELKKVSQNVQFEEIRDHALEALSLLTKALGDLYEATEETNQADEMQEEANKADEEQKRIKEELDAEAKRAEELRLQEEAERIKFKEAMDAQRELDRIAAEEAKKKREEEELKREKQKLSTKSAKGMCQGKRTISRFPIWSDLYNIFVFRHLTLWSVFRQAAGSKNVRNRACSILVSTEGSVNTTHKRPANYHRNIANIHFLK